MSFTAIMALQAIFSATIVVLEFPSGYVADRVGYRASLLIGAAFWTIGWTVYGFGTTFAAMVVAEVLLGVGMSFTSGADGALLYATVSGEQGASRWSRSVTGSPGRSERVGVQGALRGPLSYIGWEGRVRAAAQTSEAVSSALGGWLYTLAPRLPFWLQVPMAAATFANALGMREPDVTRTATRTSHLTRAFEIVCTSLWYHARLRATIALSVVLGLSSFFLVWLIQPYMQAHGVPTAWFGPIWAAIHVWLAMVSLVSHRVAATFGVSGTLFGCCLLIAVGYGGLAMGTSVFSFLFYLCLMTARGLQGPLLVQALQADAPAEDRATVLSLNAMLFRIAFTIAGPLVGLLVERAGMATALALTGGTLTVLALVTFLGFRRAHGGTLR
jgi:MFS family permease